MDKEINKILDDFNLSDTDKLLTEDTPISMNPLTLHRIKKRVYKKTNIRRNRPIKYIAAACVFLATSLFVLGFDNVSAALSQFFSFVPRYGIVENDDQILYILSETQQVSNDKAHLVLTNSIAKEGEISVMITLSLKDSSTFSYEKKEEDLQYRPTGSLYVNGTQYSEYSGISSGSESYRTASFTYSLDKELINTETKYTFAYEEYDLAVDFTLKDVDHYSMLSDIGATQYKNDISITAVPTFTENQVEVNLYPLNNSNYWLYSFFKPDTGYNGEDLHLITESGIKPYNEISSYGSGHSQFFFDIEPTDQSFKLVLPYLLVQTTEEQIIKLQLPSEGEKRVINQQVDFQDSSIVITEIEKTHGNMGEDGELKMTFVYENNSKNKILMNTSLYRTDLFGKINGGGYASEVDENGITNVVYFALEKGDGNTLRLKFSHPTYYFTDPYELEFTR